MTEWQSGMEDLLVRRATGCTLYPTADEGATVWGLVLCAWGAFRSWVGKVLTLCSLLSDCISAEQVTLSLLRWH